MEAGGRCASSAMMAFGSKGIISGLPPGGFLVAGLLSFTLGGEDRAAEATAGCALAQC